MLRFVMVGAACVVAAGTMAARQTGPGAQGRGGAPAASGPSVDWVSYGGDKGNSRYSPLDQITRENVASLRVAWRWKSDNFSAPAETRNESTPVMVNGTLYFSSG